MTILICYCGHDCLLLCSHQIFDPYLSLLSISVFVLLDCQGVCAHTQFFFARNIWFGLAKLICFPKIKQLLDSTLSRVLDQTLVG